MTIDNDNPMRTKLMQKMQQELQMNEQMIWYAYPEISRRAKQTLVRSLFSSWLMLRIVLLSYIVIFPLFTSVIYRSNSLFPLIYEAILLITAIALIFVVLLRGRTRRRRLNRTLYTITTGRLIVMSLDRDQTRQNSYYPAELGCIDLVERNDGWGDVIIGGTQRVQSNRFSLTVVSPRLSGVEKVREVTHLLTQLKSGQTKVAQQ